MENRNLTAFIITGVPGVGKTTLVRKICEKLRLTYKLHGFCTEAIEENGKRVGFDMLTMDGIRGVLAREQFMDNVKRPKVGRYSIDVKNFEEMTLPLLMIPYQRRVLMIVDEIGKMELLSKKFEDAVLKLLLQKQPLLVTVPLSRLPVVETFKNCPYGKSYTVTKSNRDGLVDKIIEEIVKIFQ